MCVFFLLVSCGFGAVPAESAQGASSDSAVMSQCSAGEEPPALVTSPQGSPSSKSRSSRTTWAPSIPPSNLQVETFLSPPPHTQLQPFCPSAYYHMGHLFSVQNSMSQLLIPFSAHKCFHPLMHATQLYCCKVTEHALQQLQLLIFPTFSSLIVIKVSHTS